MTPLKIVAAAIVFMVAVVWLAQFIEALSADVDSLARSSQDAPDDMDHDDHVRVTR